MLMKMLMKLNSNFFAKHCAPENSLRGKQSLVRSPPGVDFTNTFTRSFYSRRSQKCKNDSQVISVFWGVKADRKMSVKSTPGVGPKYSRQTYRQPAIGPCPNL